MQRMQCDNFETVLPKTERFFSPARPPTPTKPKAPPKAGILFLTGVLGVAAGFAMNHFPDHFPVEKPFANTPEVLIEPLPEVRRAAPVPVLSAPVTPRAQLVHIRDIGTWENEKMPDGRILSTLYKGELQSVTGLPRHGAIGDMWYTKNDGHCWVLGQVIPGSQTTGWIDP